MSDASTAGSGRSALRAMNLVLLTLCVSTLVAATVTLIAMIWGSFESDTWGRSFATIGLVFVSTLFGLIINRLVGRHLRQVVSLICWMASWACILGGLGVGVTAIWFNDNEEVLLKTLATIVVLLIASSIGIALAGGLGAADASRES